MYKFFWLVTLVIAFLMGYVAHQEQPFVFEDPNEQKNCTSVAASSVLEVSSDASSGGTSSVSSVPSSSASNSNSAAQQSAEKPSASEISDRDIEKNLAKPFSSMLKGTHGDTRKLYKKFAEEPNATEWGSMMQVKLKETILANNNAKLIQLESVVCKLDLCEVLLYEVKEGVWTNILSSMVLQDWWSFGQVSSLGEVEINRQKYATAYIIMLSKK